MGLGINTASVFTSQLARRDHEGSLESRGDHGGEDERDVSNTYVAGGWVDYNLQGNFLSLQFMPSSWLETWEEQSVPSRHGRGGA